MLTSCAARGRRVASAVTGENFSCADTAAGTTGSALLRDRDRRRIHTIAMEVGDKERENESALGVHLNVNGANYEACMSCRPCVRN